MFKHPKLMRAVCMLALTVAASTTAVAAAPEGSNEVIINFWTERIMKSMDRNKDGMVTRDEFMNYMGAQFDKMDQNKDKMLSKGEFMDKKMMRTTFPTGSSPE